ncbi:hypothetical protein XELAEV_18039142mg [Xenopus laevis]|uniref:Ig-like domain-containing protein n=1 Tax=Xenopus laevis TaxID=8355 RepID=A0A974C769_XENLA|nr:hypothetical protein XELAEV_18039142mg [Xenopus laevis]
MVPVCALLVLLLKASEAVTSMNNRYRIKIDYIDYGAMFYQTYGPSGEYLLDYNGNEMFHVDLESKSVVWTLPGLEKYTLFDPQAALQQINVAKYNLDIRIKRSNHTVAPNIPPLVSVYISNAVVLGEPNILICCTKNIFPPVMNTTWIKNGEIIRGFKETSYLPAQDGTFRKLHYLAFIPNDHDIYTCEVEHWGLERPTKRIWNLYVVVRQNKKTHVKKILLRDNIFLTPIDFNGCRRHFDGGKFLVKRNGSNSPIPI